MNTMTTENLRAKHCESRVSVSVADVQETVWRAPMNASIASEHQEFARLHEGEAA